MSVESSPAIIKYNDGVKVFSSAGGVRKCCCELRSCEALMSQSTWQSEGVWWMRTKYRSMCLKKNMLFKKVELSFYIFTHTNLLKNTVLIIINTEILCMERLSIYKRYKINIHLPPMVCTPIKDSGCIAVIYTNY